jgi:acetyl esterase/lipase
MRPEEYPEQEPVSEFAQSYTDDLIRRVDLNAGENHFYGPDPYQSIALFQPKRPNGTVLAFIHGGGWTNGYKEMMGYMAPAFTDRGVLFASIGYRLAPRFPWPACFDDCAAAISWLYRHASDYGGDPARIVVGGRSAGGHLSSLLAVRRDWQAALGLPSDVVRGCIPVSGVYLFGEGSGLSKRQQFLGPPEQNNDVAASPLRHIQGTPPPFFMTWGERDFPHLMRQAETMAAALRAAGASVETMTLAGCDHLGTSGPTGDPDGPWVAKVHATLARITPADAPVNA